jgi:hypothetical protein
MSKRRVGTGREGGRRRMVPSRPSRDLTGGGGASLDGMNKRRVGAGSTGD